MKDIETILYNDMKRYALRMCNGNIHDAEDMVQDLAVRVWKQIDFYLNREYTHLKSLLFHDLKILKAHNYRRSSAQKRTPPTHYEPKIVENDGWGMIQKKELQKALLQLSTSEQFVFRLKIDGYSVKEIAKIEDRELKSVWGNVIYGRKKLSKQLKAA